MNYIPIGYPITERKKRYLNNLFNKIIWINIFSFDEIEYIFKLKERKCFGSKYCNRISIIYSTKNSSKYISLKIKKSDFKERYNVDINVIEKVNWRKLFYYIIDRNLKVCEDIGEQNIETKYETKYEEDPSEISHFASLIESYFINESYSGYSDCICFREGEIQKENNSYIYNIDRVGYEKYYDSLENFVIDNMK